MTGAGDPLARVLVGFPDVDKDRALVEQAARLRRTDGS
jgi:hypothetical protein